MLASRRGSDSCGAKGRKLNTVSTSQIHADGPFHARFTIAAVIVRRTWLLGEQFTGELRICRHLLHWQLLFQPPFMTTAQHPKSIVLHPAIAGLIVQIDALRE